MNKTTAILILLTASLLLGAASAGAQTVVNRQPVTLTEVEIAVDFGLYPKQLEPAAAVSAAAVLDALIDRKVVLEVARDPSPIEKAELEQALADLRRSLGEEIFEARLKAFGLKAADLLPYLESRIRYERAVASRFSVTIPVTRNDVERFYSDVYAPAERARGMEPPPVDEVRDLIEARLKESVRNAKVSEWVRNLRNQAEVKINEDCLKSIKEPLA
jgi:hypothetical protein